MHMHTRTQNEPSGFPHSTYIGVPTLAHTHTKCRARGRLLKCPWCPRRRIQLRIAEPQQHRRRSVSSLIRRCVTNNFRVVGKSCGCIGNSTPHSSCHSGSKRFPFTRTKLLETISFSSSLMITLFIIIQHSLQVERNSTNAAA